MNMYVCISSMAFIHLLTHVFFKALLFVCAGGVIHFVGNLNVFVLWVVRLAVFLLLRV